MDPDNIYIYIDLSVAPKMEENSTDWYAYSTVRVVAVFVLHGRGVLRIEIFG